MPDIRLASVSGIAVWIWCSAGGQVECEYWTRRIAVRAGGNWKKTKNKQKKKKKILYSDWYYGISPTKPGT